MEDHIHAADTLVEEREDLMIPPCGGPPISRKAHFLKPIFTKDHLQLPPPPTSMLPSKSSFKNLGKYSLHSYKGPSKKWNLWVQTMKPKYQEMWKKSGIYEAILASTCKIPKDKKLIICVAEKWCAESNSFIFPWGENIRLGYGNGTVSPSAWMEYFMRSGKDLEHEAFLALWLSRYVLLRPQNYINKQAFRVAVHLARGNKIALAPVVLACIYRDLRVIQNSVVESVRSGSTVGLRLNLCHYDIVHMWVWERFTELRPFPKVVERGEPRSARWKGVIKLKVNDVRTALDSAGLSFLWRPYAVTPRNSLLSDLYKDNGQWVVVDSDAVESFARCLRTSVLVGLEGTEQYLPHRVAMQFGLDQDLPSDVVRSNESPDTDWSSYNRPIRGMELYIPPRLSASNVSSQYVVWWRGLKVVNEKLVTNSIQNEKHSQLASSVHKKDAKSLPTPASLLDCLEERPENYAAEDGLLTAQFMCQSEKTDSSGKKIDLDDRPVSNNRDDVEEDSLAIEQFLYQSRNRDTSEKARDVDDTELPDIVTLGLFSKCNENPKELHSTSEPVAPTLEIMTSSDKCEKSKYSTERQAEPKEDVVSRNLKFTNEPAGMSVHSMSSSDKSKKSKSLTEIPTEPEEDAVVSPEENIMNIEDESGDCEETTSDLQHLGLEARIWRLENIVDMMKAAKFASSSRGNLEK
ncbi:hypothetical protein POM88_003605 [Heracleum sosnowskyi]|uniref:Aminotransferase-like plant mobile domain-containing protein n=1 Tax=Heracleum sosnowskyi TaxID=360622 RepID=A0AAD8JG93_9APIA|nr:hypothetical protein POM88_003605 [Heracleum sosnowskyi]